jgi:hypothetical protein
MSKIINVLVFPCGSEPACEIYFALKRSLHVNLFGASSVDDHGRFIFENYIADVPRIDDPSFIAYFKNLVSELKIDVVFSTHDSVNVTLSQISCDGGFYLVNGDPITAEICRSKLKTYQALKGSDWLPKLFNSRLSEIEFPVIAKPDMGQGGNGVQLVSCKLDLDTLIGETESNWAIVEYLPGEEITVDCFTDWERELIWFGARSRDRIRAGISMRSRFVDSDITIEKIANEINSNICMRGPWFFQLKKDPLGVWKLLEVSSRIAGTMVAHRAKGINLPLMAIQDYMNRKQATIPLTKVTLIDRRLLTEAQFEYFFNDVVIDFDDTIVCSRTGKAFPETMTFLYKMVELNKRIILITRHAHNLDESLRFARICPEIFNKIIHLKKGEPKSSYVGKDSIFVDNHFPERLEVANSVGSPVFDVDTLALIRWR